MAPDWGNLTFSDIGTFIKDLQFPTTKQELLTTAEDNDAPPQILDRLQKLPDREYESITDVIESAARSIF